MNYAGQKLQSEFYSRFLLKRGENEALSLVLKPLSLGFHQWLRQIGIRAPLAPMKALRDSNGKVLRNNQGQAETSVDTRDEKFLDQLEQYHNAVAVLTIFDSLQADSKVEFETKTPDQAAGGKAWYEFSQAVFRELQEAGFTAGDMIALCREICRISNLIDLHVSAAQNSFSMTSELTV